MEIEKFGTSWRDDDFGTSVDLDSELSCHDQLTSRLLVTCVNRLRLESGFDHGGLSLTICMMGPPGLVAPKAVHDRGQQSSFCLIGPSD
jgi:hypothetical protein